MLGLYIHIPFCVRKCRYCDFLSAPACDSEREAYLKSCQSRRRSPTDKDTDNTASLRQVRV